MFYTITTRPTTFVLRTFSTHTMLSKFTLGLFTLILSTFFGSATAQDYYGQLLPRDDTSVASIAGQGDDYLASFLIANNSDSGASSQKNFKRNRVVRRMDTPAGGSRRVDYPEGFVVPLHMSGRGPRYVGEIRVGGNTLALRTSYQVVFGTAAFDLAVLPLYNLKGSQAEGPPIEVNFFDGFGEGVVCWRTVLVGGLLQKSQPVVYLQDIKEVSERSIGQAKGIFPLPRTDYNFERPPLLPPIKQDIEDQDSTQSSINQAAEDQGTTKSFIKQAVENKLIEPVFAFALRQKSGRANRLGRGELHLGTIKRDYTSTDLKYHDCVANSPFWMIDKATITVGEYKIENVRTVFDTASRYVRGPEEEVSKIYKSIETKLSIHYKTKLTFDKNREGLYVSFFTKISKHLPETTFQWDDGTKWTIPREKFMQSAKPPAGLFAAHTKFTANMKPPVMEPPLSMGPPGSESLKPHLKNVPQLPPVVNNRLLPEPKPQSGGMASDHKMHESAEVLQPGDWIIPFSVIEDRIYLILDGSNGGCKVGLTSLPADKIKLES